MKLLRLVYEIVIAILREVYFFSDLKCKIYSEMRVVVILISICKIAHASMFRKNFSKKSFSVLYYILTLILAADQEKCHYGDSKCLIRVANNVISKASQGEIFKQFFFKLF